MIPKNQQEDTSVHSKSSTPPEELKRFRGIVVYSIL